MNRDRPAFELAHTAPSAAGPERLAERRITRTGQLPVAGAARGHLWVVWFGVVLLGFFGQFAGKLLGHLLPRFGG